jgi:hypothetical protein
LLVLLAVVVCTVGHAETLLAQTEMVAGAQTRTSTFDVSSAGTLTVHLTDLAFPQRLASLSCAIVNSTSVLASAVVPSAVDAPASQAVTRDVSFDVSGPAIFSAIVSGAVSATNALQLGSYSLQVDFVPAVPIPASGLLMLSGLAVLLVLAQRRGVLAIGPAR